ncbi:MAG TPA: amino acid permease [Candidatus Polarisedimenticolaceae bacterium]|nr:amino acid permease [Candidatus Polarisedimenticolaceae bacterium]
MSGGAPPPRHLGLTDAIALYAGIILGSGIFAAPAAVAAAAPTIPRAVLLWAAGGLVAACGACCYAECASRVPANGGFFAFQREAFGPGIAFVGGWAAIFVTYPASIAAIALVFASYCGGGKAIALAAIAVAAAVNAAGLRAGPLAQRWLTAIKVSALAIVAVIAWSAPPAAPSASLPTGTLSALILLLWTYEGWSDITLVAGEIENPKRTIGRAVLIGTGLLVLVYALVQAAVMRSLGGAAAASARPLEAAAGGAGRLVSTLVVVSTFGSMLGVLLVVSRLAQAMAQSGAILPALAPSDARRGTPLRATLAVAAVSALYVAVASFRGLLAYFAFSVWIFYALAAVALVRLRRRAVGEAEAWRAPLGLTAPAVVLVTAAVVTVRVVQERPVQALAGAAMLAAGFVAYAIRPAEAAAGSGATAR